jgi:alkylated DNA repair dioxygenase AlkB
MQIEDNMMEQQTILIDSKQSRLVTMDLSRDEECMNLIEKCVEQIKDKLECKPPIKIYGKICHQQRDVGFFSDIVEYFNYSGNTKKAQSLGFEMNELLDKMNNMMNYKFNAILINRYNDGNDYIGSHADNEYIYQDNISCISYGQERIFRIRDMNKKRVIDIPMSNGQVISMQGEFQKHFYHEIPKQNKKKINNTRYSFTFRKHKT